MPDAERITLSPHPRANNGGYLKPWEKLSPISTIAIILGLKTSGLIITISLASIAILSQTHPEIVNIRPILEGAPKINAPAPLSMAQLPTIVKQTEAAMLLQLTSNSALNPETNTPGTNRTSNPAAINPTQTLSGPLIPSPTFTITNTPTFLPSNTITFTPQPSGTSTATHTSTPSKTPTATITPTIYPYTFLAYASKMSVPLQNVGFGDLHNIISQPYNVPDIHKDTGHHGVDLGSYDFHGKLIYDWPILSVFSGTVAGITIDKTPIGNTIIIETPYDQLPIEVVNEIGITPGQSLYSMYCHMLNTPKQKIGDAVTVGQEINRVGKSVEGTLTVEAHLHLEMVIGPSKETIGSMSNKYGTATEDEMKTYYWWRTSGTFVPFNPMNIFANLK